jgi:hypothetical protein
MHKVHMSKALMLLLETEAALTPPPLVAVTENV